VKAESLIESKYQSARRIAGESPAVQSSALELPVHIPNLAQVEAAEVGEDLQALYGA
jgi:hypothetical protein